MAIQENIIILIRFVNKHLVFLGRYLRLNRLSSVNVLYSKALSLVYDIGLPKNKIVLTEIQDGVRYYIDTNDRGSMCSMLVRGAYEPLQTELLKSFLKSGMTFVDVGAHIGYYSMIAAKKVGNNGHVLAFEPRRNSYDFFLRNLAANGFTNTEVFLRAVSDRPGHVKFYSDSVYNIHELAPEKEIEVETIALSSFFAAKGFTSVDAVKMDIEGGEYLALSGMKDLVLSSHDPVIFLEFNPEFYAKFGGVSIPDFWHKLSECGLDKIYAINEHAGRIEECQTPAELEKYGSINILCIRRENSAFSAWL